MSQLRNLTRWTTGTGRARGIAARAFLAFFGALFVLQLLIPLVNAWQSEPSVGVRLALTALVAMFVAAYSYTIFRMYFLRTSWTQLFTERDRWLLRACTGVPAALLVWWQGGEWALTLIFTVVVAILTGPPLRAFSSQAMAATFVAIVLASARVDTTVLLSTLAVSIVVGILIASQFRQSGEMGGLIEARYREARMAAAEERLRIAQELHDVLGHSLSLITLKSELASALAVRDPERAQREMREVEVLAREAMTDVRRTVAAERQPILSAELADARHLLDAAGIALEVRGNGETLPDEASALLAWGVREGVTNIVRHSRARHCRISLTQERDRAILAVEDDGAGPDAPGARAGTGLVGLRERAERLGGTLAFETLPGKAGHLLSASVPISSGE